MATYGHKRDDFADTDDGYKITEVPLYGSSRLGEWRPNIELGLLSTIANTFSSTRGEKSYELSNHLGNVLAVIDDNGRVLSATDYYAFGAEMPGRTWQSATVGTYRYGFNGKENDREWGVSLIQDYGMRLYNPALCRFLSVDPLMKNYPMLTPYQFSSNCPIACIDLDGLEAAPAIVPDPNEQANTEIKLPAVTVQGKASWAAFGKGLKTGVLYTLGGVAVIAAITIFAPAVAASAAFVVTLEVVGAIGVVLTGIQSYELVSGKEFGTGKTLSGYRRAEIGGQLAGGLLVLGAFKKIGQTLTKVFAEPPPVGEPNPEQFAEFIDATENLPGCGNAPQSTNISQVETGSIYDLNPTQYITKGKGEMQSLLNDVKQNGVRESIKYVENADKKWIVDGHHRYNAALKANKTEIPMEKVDLPFRGYKTIDDLTRPEGKQPGYWQYMKPQENK